LAISNYRMREQKRKRDEEKKAKMDQLNFKFPEGKTSIDNDIINQILNDEDPFAPKEVQQQVEEKAERTELKVSTFVIDMQIPAPVSNEYFYHFDLLFL